jgi:exoribonuclease R
MLTMKYTIQIHDRKYSSWSFFNENDEEVALDIPEFHPAEFHLFSNDILEIDDDMTITNRISSINENQQFAGVLVLANTRTYGRSDNKRLLYKCIPHDSILPELLVPYDQKLSFSKAFKNKYVTFSFRQWEGKHPTGIIRETLGDVDDHKAFQEYQLHAKNIHFSTTKMSRHLRDQIKDKHCPDFVEEIKHNPAYRVEDKTERCYVFTIDPEGSTDLDDAFSIQQCEDTPEFFRVTVFIANVFVWMDTMDLWTHMSQRVSTVYFPENKRTMFPSILSEDWYSLLAKKERPAFAMEILVHQDGTVDYSTLRFYTAIVCVRKNFAYEEPKLRKNSHYQKLETLTQKMDTNVTDSHDVVSFWMIFMNIQCANQLRENKTGIFRQSTIHQKDMDENVERHSLDKDTKQMLSMWNNSSSAYTSFDSDSLKHDAMDVDCYVHITSPIRRLVDTLNQITFYEKVMKIPVSENGRAFYEKWFSDMSFINTSMKSIRSIQNDCQLLHKCTTEEGIMERTFQGILFHEQVVDAGYEYQVYIRELKMMSKVILEEKCAMYQYKQFSLYLFEEEYHTKRKIRIEMQQK